MQPTSHHCGSINLVANTADLQHHLKYVSWLNGGRQDKLDRTLVKGLDYQDYGWNEKEKNHDARKCSFLLVSACNFCKLGSDTEEVNAMISHVVIP